MAFNKDLFIWIIESFITHKKSEFTVSTKPKKKFSDVANYIRENKIGKSLAGNTVTNTDSGFIFRYEYNFGGDRSSYYDVEISHRGEIIDSLKLHFKGEGASYTAKDALKRLEKDVPDYEGELVVEPQAPKENYSEKTMAELVDIFDKKLQEFSREPSKASLTVLIDIKNAISDKVNEKPLAERAPFGTPIMNINMYLDALKMQFAAPGGNPTQYVGTYVPQISAALAQLAALL